MVVLWSGDRFSSRIIRPAERSLSRTIRPAEISSSRALRPADKSSSRDIRPDIYLSPVNESNIGPHLQVMDELRT